MIVGLTRVIFNGITVATGRTTGDTTGGIATATGCTTGGIIGGTACTTGDTTEGILIGVKIGLVNTGCIKG